MLSIFLLKMAQKMCSEALISECSSLHSCALMHEPVLFTEVQTSVQCFNAHALHNH